jgi:hypothetical protein
VLIGGIGAAVLFAVIPSMMPTGWMTISKAPTAWMERYAPIATRSTVLAGRDFVHAAKWQWPEADVRLFGTPGELRWGVETFPEHAEAHITEGEFVKAVRPATGEHPVVLISTSPDRRLSWIAELVEQGALTQPAIVTDRDVVIAVWPASAMPPE